jgi:hypothetical protein
MKAGFDWASVDSGDTKIALHVNMLYNSSKIYVFKLRVCFVIPRTETLFLSIIYN